MQIFSGFCEAVARCFCSGVHDPLLRPERYPPKDSISLSPRRPPVRRRWRLSRRLCGSFPLSLFYCSINRQDHPPFFRFLPQGLDAQLCHSLILCKSGRKCNLSEEGAGFFRLFRKKAGRRRMRRPAPRPGSGCATFISARRREKRRRTGTRRKSARAGAAIQSARRPDAAAVCSCPDNRPGGRGRQAAPRAGRRDRSA